MKTPNGRSTVLDRILLVIFTVALCGANAFADRTVISLNGEWQIAEGSMDEVPTSFLQHAPVPGLVDMAKPAFVAVGTTNSHYVRKAFWYRCEFFVNQPLPAAAELKIHKAMFGAKVFLNGQLLGEHLPSFTPALFDVRSLLRTGKAANELIVRVGAFRDSVPPSIPSGWDFEKALYIPGIFDSVELILSGNPKIVRIQVAPNIAEQSIRVQTRLRNVAGKTSTPLRFTVREARSKKVVARAQCDDITLDAGAEQSFDTTVPVPNARLWSPEDPFLYELDVTTSGDALETRFGMREFRFDHATGRAVLNGRPYFLRGSNVTLYRFFEDAARGTLPWNEAWVRNLHHAFKTMHWNSLRYCIGFPPEFWYRIADEEGILIQDEFPIWFGPSRWPAELKSDELVKEYTEWMQERWNHPCVVLWDAQNETGTKETGKAIQAVRSLDLSNRPWDNGYGDAQSPGDSFESHPYLFNNPKFTLSRLTRVSGVPRGNLQPNKGTNAIILNEYGWLWINRDGTATTLSKAAYENLLGTNATPAQRRHTYARNVAALTEFWRSHRACAGVLHFCGLGYSRPDGQTCDNFIDVPNLKFETEFKEYVGDAFAPVGLMIDEWRAQFKAGAESKFPVVVINDLYDTWNGKVRLRIVRGKEPAFTKVVQCEVPPLGRQTVTFSCVLPKKAGDYTVEASLLHGSDKPVRSLRDIRVMDELPVEQAGVAQHKPVKASSVYDDGGENYAAENAVDGSPDTRWSSEFKDPQWLMVDLGAPTEISRVVLDWEGAYGRAYSIQVSNSETESKSDSDWTTVYSTTSGRGNVDEIQFTPVTARYVRMLGTKRGSPFGYSLWEMKVFSK